MFIAIQKNIYLIGLFVYLQSIASSLESHEVDSWSYECIGGECILTRLYLHSNPLYCDGGTFLMIHKNDEASFIVIELLNVGDSVELEEVILAVYPRSNDGSMAEPELLVEPSDSAYVGTGYRLAFKIDDRINYLIDNASLIAVRKVREEGYEVCGYYPLNDSFMHYYKAIRESNSEV